MLSIVIPTFNRARFLDELLCNLAIELAENPREEVEVIVLDNCSTDDTKVVIERQNRKLSSLTEFRTIRQTRNIGFAKNLEEGYRLSRFRCVWCLCDDDLIEAGALGKVLNCLKRYPDSGVFLLNRDVYDREMTEILERDKLGFACTLVVGAEEAIVRFASELVTASCVVLDRALALKGFSRPEGDGYGAESLCLALEVLNDSGLVVVGDCHVRYRGGNNGGWNILWPWYYFYGVPHVIAESRLGCMNPAIVRAFVATRKNDLFYNACYVASVNVRSFRERTKIESLYEYYRCERGSAMIIFFAFNAPAIVSKITVLSIKVWRVASLEWAKQERRNILSVVKTIMILVKRCRRFSQKEREMRSPDETITVV